MLPWLNSKSAVQAVASVLNFLALLASVVVTGFLVVEERWLMRHRDTADYRLPDALKRNAQGMCWRR
jgi:hypothetical protein